MKSTIENSPLVKGDFVMEKFPDKGGWTFARLPAVKPDKKAPFGWRIVHGSIDHVPLHNYKLMPMGDGSLFLPVKSKIRQQISKQAGDQVHIILYEEAPAEGLNEELMACLELFPGTIEAFEKLKAFERRSILSGIYYAKDERDKELKINALVDLLLNTMALDSGK